MTDLLRDWQPKLAPGGVVLLWRPWQPLFPEISHAIEAYRWLIVGPVIWDKGRPQPGPSSALTASRARCCGCCTRPATRC